MLGRNSMESRNKMLLKLFLSTLYLSAFTFGGGYVIVSLMKKKFVVTVQKKVKPEGSKRPKLVEEDETFTYEQIKYTKYLISFK